MTIDKAIDRLEDLHFEQDDWEYGELTEDCLLNREALRQAIETMRKYQKIEQIIKDHDKGSIPEKYWHIGKIREVLESEEKE